MDSDAQRKLKRWLIGVGIGLIFLPIVLDRFFAWKLYMLWCGFGIRSPRTEAEWFGFLGSYLGAAGTVLIGIVAYWQTHIISKQSEDYNKLQEKVAEMQKEISDFRIHPIIHIKTTTLHVRNDLGQACTAQKELRDYYYVIYGREPDRLGTRYIVIEIRFTDKGIIPTVQCEVSDLEWEIAGTRYCFAFDEYKRRIRAYNRIFILIDEYDIAEHTDAFFEAIDLHEHYVNNGKYRYVRSIVKMKLCFTNQKGYQQSYNLHFQIKCTTGGLKVNSMYFEREGDEDEAE